MVSAMGNREGRNEGDHRAIIKANIRPHQKRQGALSKGKYQPAGVTRVPGVCRQVDLCTAMQEVDTIFHDPRA
jgi:hypothetical protein